MIMETLAVIKDRRSVRGFDPEKQIPKDKLDKIIESAMFAPMALNRVSWHLTIVQSKEFLDEMVLDIIGKLSENPTEHIKMRLAMPKFSPFYHAPTVIFVTGDKENVYTENNAGAAIENMLLSAKDMGIDSCWIGMANDFLKSDKGKKYMDRLNTPKDWKIIGAVALGYAEKDTVMPSKHFDEMDEIVKYIR